MQEHSARSQREDLLKIFCIDLIDVEVRQNKKSSRNSVAPLHAILRPRRCFVFSQLLAKMSVRSVQ